jgi:DNA-binding LytR/AlgR family response regulator
MNVIILEDEKLSAEHLQSLLKKIDPTIMVTGIFDTVAKSVDAFSKGASADLLFVDIQLSDGLSFEIFSKIIIDTPVIFTTAFNEYAIKAFQLNSVDYLLKPIGIEELRRAIEKYKKYNKADQTLLFDNIIHAYQSISKQYKNRFLVKIGETLISIKTEDIIHYVFEEGLVLLLNKAGRRYPVEFSLEQLESILDPAEFARINRKVIIHIDAIEKVNTYFNGRLKITSPHLEDDNRIVSRERVNDFKKWFGR